MEADLSAIGSAFWLAAGSSLWLGILTSMFSAVFVSRGIVNFLYGSRRKLDTLPIGQSDWYKQQPAT